jgi:hypothetical protein
MPNEFQWMATFLRAAAEATATEHWFAVLTIGKT